MCESTVYNVIGCVHSVTHLAFHAHMNTEERALLDIVDLVSNPPFHGVLQYAVVLFTMQTYSVVLLTMLK